MSVLKISSFITVKLRFFGVTVLLGTFFFITSCTASSDAEILDTQTAPIATFTNIAFNIEYHGLTEVGESLPAKMEVDSIARIITITGTETAMLRNYDSQAFAITAGKLSVIPNISRPAEDVVDAIVVDPAGTETTAVVIGNVVSSADGEIYSIQLQFANSYYLKIVDLARNTNSIHQEQRDSGIPLMLVPCVDFVDFSFYTFSLYSLDMYDNERIDTGAKFTRNLAESDFSLYYDNNISANNDHPLTIVVAPTAGDDISFTGFTASVQTCTTFAGGNGSITAPYQLNNAFHLELMSKMVNGSEHDRYDSAHYILTADIDMGSPGAPWTLGNGFSPIGKTTGVTSGADLSYQTHSFSGQLDCNSHTISNLYISNTANAASESYDGHYIGLLGVIDTDAAIFNCILDSAKLTGYANVGGLVAVQTAGSITGNTVTSSSITATGDTVGGLVAVQTTGSITGNTVTSSSITATGDTVGGLVAVQTTGSITGNTVTSSSITATGDAAGGLVAVQTAGSITGNTVTSSSITATGDAAGGLVGQNHNGTIVNNFIAAEVSAANFVGGLAGQFSGNMQNSYFKGKVTAFAGVASGGIAVGTGNISTSYTVAAVTGHTVYGLAPTAATLSASYWDSSSNSAGTGAGTATAAGEDGAQLTTALQTPTTNDSIYVSWDADMWDFATANEYPALKDLPLAETAQRSALHVQPPDMFRLAYYGIPDSVTPAVDIDADRQVITITTDAAAQLFNYDSSVINTSAGTLTAAGTYMRRPYPPVTEDPFGFTIIDPAGTEAAIVTLGNVISSEDGKVYSVQLHFAGSYYLRVTNSGMGTHDIAQSQHDNGVALVLSHCTSFPDISTYTFSLYSLDIQANKNFETGAVLTPDLNNFSPYYDSSMGTNNQRPLAITATLTDSSAIKFTGFIVTVQACSTFAGGDGSMTSPYQVDNAFRLNLMSQRVNGNDHNSYGSAYYTLTADINMGMPDVPWAAGNGFVPIGKTTNAAHFAIVEQVHPFSGHLDCNSHTLSDLYISNTANTASGHYIGLFGVITTGAVIANCVLSNVSIDAYSHTGGLVGYQVSGMLSSNAVIASSITATIGTAGMLVGQNYNGTVIHNFAAGRVKGEGGGLIGGLIGYMGGIGVSLQPTISNSYFIGSVATASQFVGGALGSAINEAVFDDVYVAATVSGVGLPELSPVPLTPVTLANDSNDSYWDNNVYDGAALGGGTGYSSTELQLPIAPPADGTSGIYNGWDSAVWNFGSSSQYPVLHGLPLSAAQQCEVINVMLEKSIACDYN